MTIKWHYFDLKWHDFTNCGKIQPDRPAGYFGDSAGELFTANAVERLSGGHCNYVYAAA